MRRCAARASATGESVLARPGAPFVPRFLARPTEWCGAVAQGQVHCGQCGAAHGAGGRGRSLAAGPQGCQLPRGVRGAVHAARGWPQGWSRIFFWIKACQILLYQQCDWSAARASAGCGMRLPLLTGQARRHPCGHPCLAAGLQILHAPLERCLHPLLLLRLQAVCRACSEAEHQARAIYVLNLSCLHRFS